MPHHDWGDADFDFDALNRVGRYISKLYKRCTGKQIVWKEKYGTIRYEFTSAWLNDESDCNTFRAIVNRTVEKFPKYAGEVCDDLSWMFRDEKVNEFYRGIVYLHDCLNPEVERC